MDGSFLFGNNAEKPQKHKTMKEKILQKIKERLGNTQLSDRTLNEVAVNHLSQTITSDDQLTDEAVASMVSWLKVMEGQLNHEVAEKLKTQTPPTTKPTQEPTKPTPQPFELPKEIQEELEASRKFREEYLQQQQTAQLQAKRDQLFKDVQKALGEAGCTDEIMVRLAMPKIDYDKGVEDNVKVLKDVYNSELSNYASKQGYTPSIQSMQSPTAKTQEEIAVEQKARAEEFRKKGLMN